LFQGSRRGMDVLIEFMWDSYRDSGARQRAPICRIGWAMFDPLLPMANGRFR